MLIEKVISNALPLDSLPFQVYYPMKLDKWRAVLVLDGMAGSCCWYWLCIGRYLLCVTCLCIFCIDEETD